VALTCVDNKRSRAGRQLHRMALARVDNNDSRACG
jgi:hypothetical protein